MNIALGLLLLLIGSTLAVHLVVPVENWYTTHGNPNGEGTGKESEIVSQWGAADTLRYDFNSTTEVTFSFDFRDNQALAALGVEYLIEWAIAGNTLVAGSPLSEVSTYTGLAATVYGVAQLSQTTTSYDLSNRVLYPWFTRMRAATPEFVNADIKYILQMIEQESSGWGKVAVLATSDRFGLSLSELFIEAAENTPIEVLTFQTFLVDAKNVSVPMREILHSDARVIVTFCLTNYRSVLIEAKRIGLLDKNHVFITGPSITDRANSYQFPNGTLDTETVENLRGHLGVQTTIVREGTRYDRLYEQWIQLDPSAIRGGGPGTEPSALSGLAYDMGVVIVKAAITAHRAGLLTDDRMPTGAEWYEVINSLEFEGASGYVKFNDGDRPMSISLYNWQPERLTWVPVAEIPSGEEVQFDPVEQVIWYDNTTIPPDLMRAPGYEYWSCHEKKMKYDETGHSVKLHRPGSQDVDDIDSDYVCDNFIDCQNLSDESYDGCSTNYMALFIAFGIVTGLLILATCCLIPFVILFGFVLPRRRIKASSPFFLLIIILSCLLGYISEYSWYGKAHPVACGFRPWLLGLAITSLVSALSAKTWRLWRIFKSAHVTDRISDLQLMVLYSVMMLPAVVILVVWTIVSTPTADMEDKSGDDHYVCTTGGFTGKPGGLIFFFILVGYEAVVLLFAAFLSIVTRNVPSFFNESKLIAISIYNLGFLAAVVIPVVLVLDSINPFAAWIIRSIAVLYAFTATLILQFASKVAGIILIDRGGDAPLPKLGKTWSSSSETGLTGSSRSR